MAADIFLSNTLSKKKELFKPLITGKVSMYHCGPTVYNKVHIGNLRTFLLNDILRRVFLFNGYKVHQVMNITDVDDKTINASQKAQKKLKDFTAFYEEKFKADIGAMNIAIPDQTPRATEHIKDMIELIQKLIDSKHAYIGEDGVYFRVNSELPHPYGSLAHIDFHADINSSISSGSLNDEYDKEQVRDFALWKFYTEKDGDVSWEAPFGKGRPGWHIECSAMSMNAFGPTLDIHTGATDLIFPHHENEIAQSEAATGKTFVNYWVHGAFLNVANEKMAKSVGNFFTLDDIIEKGFSPLAFRYLLLTAHYSTLMNFSLEGLQAAQNAYNNLIDVYHREKQNLGKGATDKNSVYTTLVETFTKYINDDLDTPKSLALLWTALKDPELSPAQKVNFLELADTVLGFGIANSQPNKNSDALVSDMSMLSDEVRELLQKRLDARLKKDWTASDILRQQLAKLGFEITDVDGEQKIKSIK